MQYNSERNANQHLKSVAPAGSGSWDGATTYGFDTTAVHSGCVPDPTTGAILTPIYQSTTFVQESIEAYQRRGYSYSRSANPTVSVLEERLTVIEGGAGATVYATGMAATITAFMTFMSAGDHAVVTNCSYGGTNRACRVFLSRFNLDFTFVSMATSLDELCAALKPNTKVIFTESPANPTLVLTDVAAVSQLCRERNLIHICDNTFSTGLIMRPIELGADITLISTTKFIDGHNITVGGALVARTKEINDKLRFNQNILGNNMTPMTAYYQLQTVKTLSLRVTRQSETALKVAQFLETHPKVEKVAYPGLPSHPQHALALKQHRNGIHGSMLWFEVKGGVDAGRKLMDTVPRPWSLCENLGATESIITCPSVMTHANMLREDRLKVGITDGFIRVSCGIEDAVDLIAALKVALDNL